MSRIVDNRKGLVIVAVLWVVMLLMIIIAGVGRSSRLETKVCDSQVDHLRGKWGVIAGVEFAAALIDQEQQITSNVAEQLLEINRKSPVELEGCEVDFIVVDESGKLNINTATKGQLMGLYLMTEDIADAIIDWRDSDDEPENFGAESGYYANLPYGYMIRNNDFRTVRELLMVKGVTEELLFGEKNAEEDEETGFTEKQEADQYQEDVPWIYDLTCYSRSRNEDAEGNRRVNINRVNQRRLERDLEIKSSQAKWIVDNRGNGFDSIADLLSESSSSGGNNNQNQSNQNQNSNQNGNRNNNASGNQSNQNQEQAEQIDTNTFSEIADKITVNNRRNLEGLININTASRRVLAAILGEGDRGIELAEGVIAYRENNIEGFTSIADLLNVNGFKVEDLKRIAEYITTKSNVYMIICESVAGEVKVSGETMIDTRYDPYRLLYRYKGISN